MVLHFLLDFARNYFESLATSVVAPPLVNDSSFDHSFPFLFEIGAVLSLTSGEVPDALENFN